MPYIFEMKKYFKRLLVLAGAYGALVLGFYLLQPFFIFQPDDLPETHEFAFDTDYLQHDTAFQESSLTVAPGVELNLIHFKTNRPKMGTILYFHGNADNLQRWGQYHTDFTSRGYDVWMYDYRGYGKSDGRPGDAVFYADAKKVFDWVQSHHPDEDITLYGRSLGTSIASELATKVVCDSLILEAPFGNLDQLFKLKFPWLWQPFAQQYDFANDRHLALQITAPVHIIHGTKDKVVPFESSIPLKEYLLAKDSYTLIRGGGHKNLSKFSDYQYRLTRLLSKL